MIISSGFASPSLFDLFKTKVEKLWFIPINISGETFPEHYEYKRVSSLNKAAMTAPHPLRFTFVSGINIPDFVPEMEASTSTNNFILLSYLFDDYNSGKKDIPELTLELGNIWTEEDVIRMLEEHEISRKIISQTISTVEEDSVLNKLADIHESNTLEKHNDETWVRRQVSSLQRISAIYVSPEDFDE